MVGVREGTLIVGVRMMDAAEAERSGLVSRIVPADKLMDEVMAAAEKIAAMSRPAAAMAKEAVNRALETTLAEGMSVERNLFHATFALEDRAEGMSAPYPTLRADAGKPFAIVKEATPLGRTRALADASHRRTRQIFIRTVRGPDRKDLPESAATTAV